MKTMVTAFSLITALSVSAQTTLQTARPSTVVVPAPPAGSTTLSMPGATVQSSVPSFGTPQSGTTISQNGAGVTFANNGTGFTFGQNGLLAFTNAFPNMATFTFTNTFGTNIALTDLMTLLAQLQNDMQQVIPALAALNNQFEFANVTPTVQSSAVVGTNAAVAARLPGGANLRRFGTTARVLTPTGVTNSLGLSPGFAASAGILATNPVAATVARDELRTLIILQNDLERSLPLVAALNGGVGLGSGNVPAVPSGTPTTLTNGFGSVPGPALGGAPLNGAVNPTVNRRVPAAPVPVQPVRPLTPTGR
jgi:hypothetical protein